MPSYVVKAAIDGSAVDLAVETSASLALSRLRSARTQHARVWICDVDGNDLSAAELIRQADEERRPG